MGSKGKTMKNRSPSYKLLLENSAEENNTQFRKESKAQDFSVVVAFIKKKVWNEPGEIFTIMPKQSLQQSEKQNTIKEGTSRTIKPSGLNSEPNIFTDQLDSKTFILRPKIKLGVLVILLHCTSHLNYSTFKNIRLLT